MRVLLPFCLLLSVAAGPRRVCGQAAASSSRVSGAGSGGSTAAKVFRISGVVVNSRDGSPVAKCEVRVTDAALPQRRAFGAGGGGFQGRFPEGIGGLIGDSGSGGNRQGPFGGGQPGGAGRRGGGDAGSSAPEPATTDAQGRFSIVVPHQGVWHLTATARGFRVQNYEPHDGFWEGVVVSAAAPETAVRFRLAADGTISGTVYDEAGEGVRKAEIRVWRVQPPMANTAQRPDVSAGFGLTDDRGQYEVSGLAPGEYRLRVTARPWYATAAHPSNGAPESGPIARCGVSRDLVSGSDGRERGDGRGGERRGGAPG